MKTVLKPGNLYVIDRNGDIESQSIIGWQINKQTNKQQWFLAQNII